METPVDGSQNRYIADNEIKYREVMPRNTSESSIREELPNHAASNQHGFSPVAQHLMNNNPSGASNYQDDFDRQVTAVTAISGNVARNNSSPMVNHVSIQGVIEAPEDVTTQIVASKRTGEGDWDEEIPDRVLFQEEEIEEEVKSGGADIGFD